MLVCGVQTSRCAPFAARAGTGSFKLPLSPEKGMFPVKRRSQFASISDGFTRAAVREADYHARCVIKSLLIVKLVYMHLVSALFVHPVMNKTCAACERAAQ